MAEEYVLSAHLNVGDSRMPLDPERCKAAVRGQERWRSYRQCTRKAGVDGWCKAHHPDTERNRQAASTARHGASSRRYALGTYGGRFMVALIAIRDGDNDPRATAANALEGCKYATPQPIKES